jgi:ABC-type branched-subunit amino acid transport system ATPase component
MGEGRVVTSGRPEEVRADPRVIEAYLGAEAVDQVGSDG